MHLTLKNFLPAALAAGNLYGCANTQNNKDINILVIHADELRFDCIGAYGNKDVKTPNIDRLASDGVLYQNSYCTLPVSTPSRYSLLSGLYVHEHQGWNNRSTLNPSIKTFPEVLRQSGYKTVAVGKMHFTPTYLDVGFDKMLLAEQDGPGRWDDDYHRFLMMNDLYDRNDLEDQRKEYRDEASAEYWKTFGAEPSNLGEEFSSTKWISDQSIKIINTWNGSKNLLMISFIKPHHPFDPPDTWMDKYNPDSLSLLPGWVNQMIPYDSEENPGYFPNKDLTESALRLCMAYYYSTISQIDYEIGRIITSLEEKGVYDKTMIIFTSDHGDHMGYHHQILKGGFLYESIMRVPLIIKYPSNLNMGKKDSSLVSNVDIAPTILKNAGLNIPGEMSGYDLTSDLNRRDTIFGEGGSGKISMAGTLTRKLIYKNTGKSLYFDLEQDPLEMNNLFENPAYKEEIKSFIESITKWQEKDRFDYKNYLDENAPVIQGSNVRVSNDGHRDVMIEYFKNKMKNEKQ